MSKQRGGGKKGGGGPSQDLKRWVGEEVCVKFHGGREVTGVLKGVDMMANLVIEEAVERLREPEDDYSLSEDTRKLGVVVARGTSVILVYPTKGSEEVANPWEAPQEAVI